MNSGDGSKPSKILFAIESGGIDTYFAATEDTNTRVKTIDPIISFENDFIMTFLMEGYE